MNQTAKVILVLVGIAAVYHFFFRSITPVATTQSTGGKAVDEAMKEAGKHVSVTDQEAEFADIPNGYPMREFLGTQSTGEDNAFEIETTQRTELLR